mgnify:CR=1 FL=1
MTTLSVGDYSVRFKDGSSPPVAVERKSLSDLYGTMTQGYHRFKEEMQRAKDTKIDLILGLENTLGEVAEGVSYSKFDGSSMVKKLMTLEIRYGLRVVYCRNRLELARWIIEYFSAIGREHVSGLPHPFHSVARWPA